MLILLPILAWGSFFLILHRYHHHPWREALLRAMVIWGVTLAVITELLSGLQLLTPLGVSLAWFGVMAISTFVVWRYGGRFAVKWPAWRWRLPPVPVHFVSWGSLDRGYHGREFWRSHQPPITPIRWAIT